MSQSKYIWQRNDWPSFVWDDRKLQKGLRKLHTLRGRFVGTATLDESASQRSALEALLRNAISTSAIEGEVLDVASLRSSLARRLCIPLPEGAVFSTAKVDGVVNLVVDATGREAAPLTLGRLFHWHSGLFSGKLHMKVGELRGSELMQVVSGPFGRQTVHFEAPPRKGLNRQLERFLQWFNQSQENDTIDPFVRAGVAHLWFLTLHPFDDGNGRIARAISDLALAQSDHIGGRLVSMATAIEHSRSDYYRLLESTQKGTLEIDQWLIWFLDIAEQAISTALEKIDVVLLKTKFWNSHRNTVLNARQTKVLNRILDAGQDGFEGGMNARKYGHLTKVSKATATRDLVDLLAKGCIVKRPGGGRSVSYDANWPTGA